MRRRDGSMLTRTLSARSIPSHFWVISKVGLLIILRSATIQAKTRQWGKRTGSEICCTATTFEFRKKLLTVSPRILHQFMMEDFPPSVVNDKVIITESQLRKTLKRSCSHVKRWTKREKQICGCEICTLFEDVHGLLVRLT